MLNILLGLIPEAIYFSLFIIFTKDYKKNRILFAILLTLGYIALKQIFPVNVYCQVCYILYVPFIMWLTNREKFHISDIFVMNWASVSLIALTLPCLPIFLLLNNYVVFYIAVRLLMIIFLVCFKNKLRSFYKWIIPQWNRNREKPNPIKALTIRNICVFTLNITIFIIYLSMIFTSTQNIIR